MAIDEKASTATKGPADAEVIDNEIPAYRAISPGAIVSLVLGIASVFCFTDLWFLIVVASSILIGLLSLRKIRRLPEILTGAVYARAGIALALVFGLSSVTHIVASDFLIDRDASRFASQYAEVLKSQPVAKALWFQQAPDYRKLKKPEEIDEELKLVKNPATPDFYRDKTLSITKLKERLKGPNEEMHFARIESKAVDGLTVYANALIEFDGPGTAEFPKEQFALVELIKEPGGGPNDWTVKEVRFPYKPASAVAVVEKKGGDDGHGHGH